MIAVHPVDAGDPDEGQYVRAQVRRLGITEPVYLDVDFKAVRELRGSVYPTFALIDRQGMVRYRLAGALTNRGERALTAEIEKLLGEK